MSIDVTPESLRAAASEYSAAGSEVMGAAGMGGGDGAMIAGTGDNTSANLSPQLFRPGAEAQQMLAEAINGYTTATMNMMQNCLGIGSALWIVADAYASTDHREALGFAFLWTSEPPAGMPEHIDGGSTVGDQLDGAGQGGPESQ